MISANKKFLSILILIVSHLVGIVGIGLLNNFLILSLTPINLLLSLVIIMLNHPTNKRVWVFYLTFLLTFIIEVVGVKTGWLFGSYSYGPILGWKFFETPAIIGVNWVILLYGANSIANYVGLTAFTRSLCAAALMVFIDYLIEPVAITLNFWTWTNGHPPLENYIGWFAVAFLFSLLWQLSKVRLNQSLGIAVYIIQLLFFAALLLIL